MRSHEDEHAIAVRHRTSLLLVLTSNHISRQERKLRRVYMFDKLPSHTAMIKI